MSKSPRRHVARSSSTALGFAPRWTTTCAEITFTPLVIVHTCRSWMSITPLHASTCSRKVSTSTLRGVASRRTSIASRRRLKERGTISATMRNAANVSASWRPATMFATAEMITATDAATSARTSRYAARTASEACGSRNRRIDTPLLMRPTVATARTSPLWTWDGSLKRRIPSSRTTLATTSSRTVLRTVASISSRRSPKVRRSVAGRAASQTATNAIPRATTSMRTWNASARRARLFAKMDAVASTAKTTTASANATAVAAGMKMRGMAEQKGIKHVIAVMSGKGGVGKSLVAGLLAVGLKRRGFRVGVLDGDITGPSIPRMFGVREKPVSSDGKTLNPPKSRGGIPIMSMNLLLPEEGEAVIWRGPMVSGAIRQFFSDVQWGELDYLIVDLPPGTSDAPLTVMQALPVSGVVLVTTPQALATLIVGKAVRLVKQLGGDIVGVVENMSYVAMPDGSKNEVFGPSQGLKLVIASNAPLMAKLPIDPEIARLADAGLIEFYESPESEELLANFIEVAPEKHPQVAVA